MLIYSVVHGVSDGTGNVSRYKIVCSFQSEKSAIELLESCKMQSSDIKEIAPNHLIDNKSGEHIFIYAHLALK